MTSTNPSPLVVRSSAERELQHDTDSKAAHARWCSERGLEQKANIGELFNQTFEIYAQSEEYIGIALNISATPFLNTTERYMLLSAWAIGVNSRELEEGSILRSATLEKPIDRTIVMEECYNFIGDIVSGVIWPEEGTKPTIISRMKIIQAKEHQVHGIPTHLSLAAQGLIDIIEMMDSKKPNGDYKGDKETNAADDAKSA